MLNASNEQMCDLIAGHGMEWNVNFGMKYGRCQNGMEDFKNGMEDFKNGMEDFKNGMEDNLPYFHTNSILDFAHGIYRKTYRDSDN